MPSIKQTSPAPILPMGTSSQLAVTPVETRGNSSQQIATTVSPTLEPRKSASSDIGQISRSPILSPHLDTDKNSTLKTQSPSLARTSTIMTSPSSLKFVPQPFPDNDKGNEKTSLTGTSNTLNAEFQGQTEESAQILNTTQADELIGNVPQIIAPTAPKTDVVLQNEESWTDLIEQGDKNDPDGQNREETKDESNLWSAFNQKGVAARQKKKEREEREEKARKTREEQEEERRREEERQKLQEVEASCQAQREREAARQAAKLERERKVSNKPVNISEQSDVMASFEATTGATRVFGLLNLKPRSSVGEKE